MKYNGFFLFAYNKKNKYKINKCERNQGKAISEKRARGVNRNEAFAKKARVPGSAFLIKRCSDDATKRRVCNEFSLTEKSSGKDPSDKKARNRRMETSRIAQSERRAIDFFAR